MGKFAASEACKSHHRPCAASYRVDAARRGARGVTTPGWQRLKPSLADRSKTFSQSLGPKRCAASRSPLHAEAAERTGCGLAVAGGRRMVGGGAGPRSLVRLVRLVLHHGGRHKQFGNCVSPFLGPRPRRRKYGLLDLNSVAPKLGSRGGRRRRSRARVLHTMANCRPGRQGLPLATGPSLKFLWRKTLEPIDGCFHFGCARKMDRLGQPSRASVMDDMDERSKRDHAGPRFPAANAWLGSDPVRLQMSGPGKWCLSCFGMTGDGGCTLGGMRWNRSGT